MLVGGFVITGMYGFLHSFSPYCLRYHGSHTTRW